MKSKITSMLDTTKKKVAAVVLCGTFIAAIGTGTVFAANSMNSLQVKMENGVKSYSIDDGKTWSRNAPDGVRLANKMAKLPSLKALIQKMVKGMAC
jgi:hypothetical protein